MTKVIRRKSITAVLLTTVTALLIMFFILRRDNTRLESFRSDSGWGYSVTVHGKPVIYQPFIPAIEGNKPFKSRRDALRAGRIVIRKMRDGVEPSITTEELHKAGISTT